MTVKDLVTKLLDFDMDEDVSVSLDNKEKIGHIESIEAWHGMPIIHFDDWTKSGRTCETCRYQTQLTTVCLECEYEGPTQGFSRYEELLQVENVKEGKP